MRTGELIGRGERRWSWRTWNLLLQIERATDGNDPRQRSGEMTVRALSVARGPALEAFARRLWVCYVGHHETRLEGQDDPRPMPAWVITSAGRRALEEARQQGIQIQ